MLKVGDATTFVSVLFWHFRVKGVRTLFPDLSWISEPSLVLEELMLDC